MRAALALCLILTAACSSTVGQRPAQASPSGVIARQSPHGSPSRPAPTASPDRSGWATGGVVEYPVPNPSAAGSSCSGCGRASLSGITSGPDGNIWFFDVGKNTVGRLTPDGTITEFPVPATGSGQEAITGAPDGNIWMVSRGPNQFDQILKVTTSGVVTAFPIAKGSGPEGITWGPDGNLWFTEFWTDRVARMTPAGTVTEFPLTPTSAPRGIVTGPDHNLWIVESAWERTSIARLTTTGQLTEFPIVGTPPQQLQPTVIVAGPDGNLWFDEVGRIGRITPAGEVTQFPLPRGHSSSGVATGADGNIWFTSYDANTVGRISPSGVIRQFPLARRNAYPAGIASGAHGRMWFIEGGSSSIASIGLLVPEASFSSHVMNFGSGSNPSIRAVITNTGDGPLHEVSVNLAGADPGAFSIVSDSCSGQTVAGGAQCVIDVAFSPTAATGIVAAFLSVVDNATGSPHIVSLVGRLPDCQLPLYSSDSRQGQFLSPLSGKVADDPSAAFVADQQTFRSVASPVLYGTQPASYDRAAQRWVPAPAEAVSSDGARYAYVLFDQGVGGNRVHVVDVATGHDRVLPVPTGWWGILAFASEGIYVHQSYEVIGPGLTLINPDSGATRTVFGDAAAHRVAGSVAWIASWNAADTLPQPPGIGGGANQVQRRDLTTSATTTWMYKPGTNLFVWSATEGSIVVSGYDGIGSYVWFVGAAGQAEPISGPELTNPIPYASTLIDTYGVWVGTPDGLFLWTHRTGPILVSDTAATPAGACA